MDGATILVVDDEPGIIDIVRVNLEAEGYRVASSATGDEALSYLKRATPDLVILDIMLPGIDGWQVLREIEADQRTSGIPVVILSALVANDQVLYGLEQGAIEYITKPFYPGDLVASVKIIIDVFDQSLREDYRHQRIAKRKRLLEGQDVTLP